MAKQKRAVGRPSLYKAEYAEQARKLCLLGLTDKELGKFFGVSEQTINAWKKNHSHFLESIQAGRVIADAEVAASTYHRAIGYSHPEDKILQDKGVPIIVPTTKHYPPDYNAARLWLMNRQRNRWQDKPTDADNEQPPTPVQINIMAIDASHSPGE